MNLRATSTDSRVLMPSYQSLLAAMTIAISTTSHSALPDFGDTPDRPIIEEIRNLADDPETGLFVLTKCAGLFLYMTQKIDESLTNLSVGDLPKDRQRSANNFVGESIKLQIALEQNYIEFYSAASSLGNKLGKKDEEIDIDTVQTAFAYERYHTSLGDSAVGGMGPISQEDGKLCNTVLKGL